MLAEMDVPLCLMPASDILAQCLIIDTAVFRPRARQPPGGCAPATCQPISTDTIRHALCLQIARNCGGEKIADRAWPGRRHPANDVRQRLAGVSGAGLRFEGELAQLCNLLAESFCGKWVVCLAAGCVSRIFVVHVGKLLRRQEWSKGGGPPGLPAFYGVEFRKQHTVWSSSFAAHSGAAKPNSAGICAS